MEKRAKKVSYSDKKNKHQYIRIGHLQIFSKRNNTMQCAEKNEAADGRHADSYSQCAGGRRSVLPLIKELCINLGVKNVNL